MQVALHEAEYFVGTTAPNPPVGAVLLDKEGQILAKAAHAGAGTAHAEVIALETAKEKNLLQKAHTLVVTLEPCNHYGRTPPCTAAIIAAGIKQVCIGTRDPNPKVAGGGVEKLKASGIIVYEGILEQDCKHLIRSFAYWSRTGKPWVTIKRALQKNGSMIPPQGQKTFSSELSLRFAHQLRKRADAIITGSGTILADMPLLTVRKVPDHPGKTRWLVILDRRSRVPEAWKNKAQERGFKIISPASFEEALVFLGEQGVLEALVEAGPTLSNYVIENNLWNEDVQIHASSADGNSEDEIRVIQNYSTQ